MGSRELILDELGDVLGPVQRKPGQTRDLCVRGHTNDPGCLLTQGVQVGPPKDFDLGNGGFILEALGNDEIDPFKIAAADLPERDFVVVAEQHHLVRGDKNHRIGPGPAVLAGIRVRSAKGDPLILAGLDDAHVQAACPEMTDHLGDQGGFAGIVPADKADDRRGHGVVCPAWLFGGLWKCPGPAPPC